MVYDIVESVGEELVMKSMWFLGGGEGARTCERRRKRRRKKIDYEGAKKPA